MTDNKIVNNQTDELKNDKEIKELKKQLDEYKKKYLRALADYQNFEKRVMDQREEMISHANRRLIMKLLEFLDNLDKAEIFVKDEHLKIIKESFQKLLQEEGLKELDIKGKEYDPYTGEVIDIVEGGKDNQVVEVLRKGYELGGKIIRVAQVKVSKKVQKKGN